MAAAGQEVADPHRTPRRPRLDPRAAGVVPGLAVVGASGLAGLAVFAYLALAARALDPAASDAFSAFWALALLLAFGAFSPVEAELARTLGHRPDVGEALRAAARAAAVIAAAVAVLVLAASPLLLPVLGGSGWLLLAVVGVVVVSALQFWVRGALLGQGRTTAFAATLAADSALRVAGAAVLVALPGSPGAAAFSATLVVAVLVAHAAFVPSLRRGVARASGEAPPAATPPSSFLRRIGPLFVASGCAQVLLNAPAVVVAASASSGPAGAATAFLVAFTLARVPLFVAVPVQGALVPPMAAMVAAGRTDRLVARLLAVGAGVLVVAVLGGALAARLGEPVLGALLPGRPLVGGGDLALMVVGVAAHIGLLVTAQAVLATGHHRGAATAWATGLAVAVLVYALGAAGGTADPAARVEWAFAAGSAAGWGTAVLVLLLRTRSTRSPRSSAGVPPGAAA